MNSFDGSVARSSSMVVALHSVCWPEVLRTAVLWTLQTLLSIAVAAAIIFFACHCSVWRGSAASAAPLGYRSWP
jgi:hypothetical protein